MHLYFVVLLCLVLFPCLSPAADGKEKTSGDPSAVYRMDDVVVTGKNRGIIGPEISENTTVITRADIESSPALDMDDLLKNSAGIQVWQPWGLFGPDSKTTLRGFSQSRATRFLKDGLPVNRVICGGTKTDEFPLEMVESITISRGMSGSLKGTSAMAGVINIETRTPGDETEAFVKSMYGTYDTWRNDVFFSTPFTPRWGLVAGFHHFDTDGYTSWSDQWIASKHQEWGQLDHKGRNTIDNFDAAIDKQTRTTKAASGRLVYSPAGRSGNTTISLDAGYWHNDVHNSMQFNDNVQERRRATLSLSHGGRFDTRVALSCLDEEFSFDRPFTPTPDSFTLADSRFYYKAKGKESRIPVLDYTAVANTSFSRGDHHRLTVGTTLRHGTIENEIKSLVRADGMLKKSDLMQGKQYTGTLSLSDEIYLEKLTVVLRAQYERIKLFDTFYEDRSILEEYPGRTDDQFNPAIGLVYQLSDETALSGSVGRSSNFPTLMSLFGIFEQPPGRERIGNPLLKTEYALGIEAGVAHQPSAQIRLRLTGFYNRLYDWMESTSAREDLPDMDLKENAVVWQNVDRATTAGVEFETHWDVSDRFRLFGNYTYTHTRIERFDEARIRYKYHTRMTTHNREKAGNELANQPRHSAGAGMTYSHPRLANISLTGRYVGDRYYDVENTEKLDAYVTLDLKVSKTLGRHVRASITATNLLDEDWRDDDRHRQPGRMIFAGLKVGF